MSKFSRFEAGCHSSINKLLFILFRPGWSINIYDVACKKCLQSRCPGPFYLQKAINKMKNLLDGIYSSYKRVPMPPLSGKLSLGDGEYVLPYTFCIIEYPYEVYAVFKQFDPK